MGISIEGFISYAFVYKSVRAITEAFCVIFQSQLMNLRQWYCLSTLKCMHFEHNSQLWIVMTWTFIKRCLCTLYDLYQVKTIAMTYDTFQHNVHIRNNIHYRTAPLNNSLIGGVSVFLRIR